MNFFCYILQQQLHEAKQLMAEWTQLISELSLQKDKLDALATGSNDLGWRQELEKAQKLKVRILMQQLLDCK